MAYGSTTFNRFLANLQVFKGEHYDKWRVMMKVIFRIQDVLEIMNNGFLTFEADAIETQRTTHYKMSKKYGKKLDLDTLVCGSKCLWGDHWKQRVKGVWDTLNKLCGGMTN